MKVKDAVLLENEIKNLKAVSHPYTIKLFDVYTDANYVHLVTEFCEGGELLAKLRTCSTFDEDKALEYLNQMLTAVGHLHSLNMCHRDLKLENFMLTTSDQNSSLKLIDFGFTKQFEPSEP